MLQFVIYKETINKSLKNKFYLIYKQKGFKIYVQQIISGFSPSDA